VKRLDGAEGGLRAVARMMFLALLALGAGRAARALPPADIIENGFSVYDRVVQYGNRARQRLAPYFRAAGVDYPPQTVVLVGLKREMRLELYAGNSPDALKFIRYYGVLAASGRLGPKLREGDLQVPEGVYRLTQLNPNSKFHLSLKVDYPNTFDRLMGKVQNRRNLGGNIFIHGNSVSVGCLAMGDSAVEEIFTLVAQTGVGNASIILSPLDMRREPAPNPLDDDVPVWAPNLYAIIRRALRALPPARYGAQSESRWARSEHPIE
jgi:L,D-transpeptidase catalytic domain